MNQAQHLSADQVTPPTASLLLLCYNQQEFVREAAVACLAQACEPIEIIFSDDASTDRSFDILQELAQAYVGPHQVKLNRNPRNLGIGGHYNLLVKLAHGQLLITAAGDDLSEPHRVASLLEAWRKTGSKANLITSHLSQMNLLGEVQKTIFVDDLSKWTSVEHWLAHRPRVVGAAHAFTKALHQHFGDFDAKLSYEDQIMALRASHLGGGLLVPKNLVRYREGGVSSGTSSITRQKSRIRRHRNHLALYAQVHTDLARIGKAELFPLKMRLRLERAKAFVMMSEATGHRSRLQALMQTVGRGIVPAVAGLEAFIKHYLIARNSQSK